MFKMVIPFSFFFTHFSHVWLPLFGWQSRYSGSLKSEFPLWIYSGYYHYDGCTHTASVKEIKKRARRRGIEWEENPLKKKKKPIISGKRRRREWDSSINIALTVSSRILSTNLSDTISSHPAAMFSFIKPVNKRSEFRYKRRSNRVASKNTLHLICLGSDNTNTITAAECNVFNTNPIPLCISESVPKSGYLVFLFLADSTCKCCRCNCTTSSLEALPTAKKYSNK